MSYEIHTSESLPRLLGSLECVRSIILWEHPYTLVISRWPGRKFALVRIARHSRVPLKIFWPPLA